MSVHCTAEPLQSSCLRKLCAATWRLRASQRHITTQFLCCVQPTSTRPPSWISDEKWLVHWTHSTFIISVRRQNT